MSLLKKIAADDDEAGGAFKVNLVKQISSSTSITLPDNVLNLVLTGKANISGTGNGLDNVITGNAGHNGLYGNAGNDHLHGQGGDDSLNGGKGNDRLYGGEGSDWMEGGDGNDWMEGGAGIDDIFGSNGNDRIYGGAGNDSLLGDSGNDWIDGGAGADRMQGGDGSDTYIIDDVNDMVIDYGTGAKDIDSIFASVSYSLSRTLVENLTLTGKAKIDATGTYIDNVLTGNAGSNTLSGLEGNDTLHGQGGDDYIEGGDGNDVLSGGTGLDVLIGGAGHDRFVFKSVAESTGGQAGHDRIGDRSPGEGFERGDLIDLSAIDANVKLAGDQAFSLVKALSGHAGELQVTKLTTNSLLVLGDVNGDARADFVVQVDGLSQLQKGDFLL